MFSQKRAGVGYTGKSGLTGVAYNGKSRLSGVAYTGKALVPPSKSANALKVTIPQNQTVSVKYRLLGRDSCVYRGVDVKCKELYEF